MWPYNMAKEKIAGSAFFLVMSALFKPKRKIRGLLTFVLIWIPYHFL